MNNKFFTVLILRSSGPRFRRLRMSYPFVSTAAALLLVLMVSGLYAPRLLARLETQTAVVDRLEQENSRLRSERNAFQGALSQVTGDFELNLFEGGNSGGVAYGVVLLQRGV